MSYDEKLQQLVYWTLTGACVYNTADNSIRNLLLSKGLWPIHIFAINTMNLDLAVGKRPISSLR